MRLHLCLIQQVKKHVEEAAGLHASAAVTAGPVRTDSEAGRASTEEAAAHRGHKELPEKCNFWETFCTSVKYSVKG